MPSKPRLILKTVDGKAVPVNVDPVARARERFGAPFAHEPGATWKPRSTPFLTEWMQSRGQK